MGKRLLFLITSFILVASSAKVMAANATLSNLTISSGTLSPNFTSNTHSYNVIVSDNVGSVTVRPTQNLNGSTIKVNGNTVTSNTNSGAISLNPGDNAITIVVSKSGNTTITYTITVTQEDITYTGSPFTYTAGTAIPTLTPNTTDPPTSVSISPALPAGLNISNAGVISGTPTVTSAATNYTVVATFAPGITATTSINITVNPAPPSISYSPVSNTYQAGTTIASLTPVNTGGAATSWSISPGLPAGLLFNTSTGVISGTPTAQSLFVLYTITATNAGGNGTFNINITVNNPSPPAISYSPSINVYTVGTAISPLSPTNSGGPVVSYSITPGLPAGLSFNTSTGVISGTPTATSPVTSYTVTATNGGGTSNAVVKLSCVNPAPPVISYTPSSNNYNVGTTITAWAPANTGGAVVSYSISPGLPAGLSFNTSTGVITGTPTAVTATASYTVTATNTGGSGSTAITITVNPAAPVISYAPSANIYTVGTAIASLTPVNTGGPVVSYSVSPALPAGLSLNTTTGVITGTPTAVTATASYTVTATNTGGSGSTTITLTVNPQPPVISYSPSANVYVINTAIIAWSPTNTGGPAASYAISPALPAGLLFDTATGTISGTPTALSTITTYTITATNAGGSSSTTIKITVNPSPPVISYTPNSNTFTVGTAITAWTPVNTGGASTNYSIGPALPAGLSFNITTGAITGTPTAASPATVYTISADNDGGVGTTSVTITCVNPSLPNISYSPSANTYTVGTAITSLSPANTGGAVISYSINTPLPAGLSFDTGTGIISGTPTAVSATTTYTITGTNSVGSSSTTVTLTVNPAIPVISYTPSTNTYSTGATISSLTPTNTGGAATSWSISAPLPAGLSFNASTGVISGTPTATAVTKTYTITATNATGNGYATVTITVNSTGPNISYSPATVSFSVGAPITPVNPINTGGAASTWTITGATLPTGLSFNTSTGVITGTPTVEFPTATFTIKATNANGTSTTSLIITVSPHAPVISYTPSTNVYTLNSPIPNLDPTNTGGAVLGYTYSSTGTKLTGATLSGPSLMTIDASGNIYVANYNNATISKYNSSGAYVGKYTSGKSFTNPEGIVFDSAGNCYVEDTGAGAVYKFNALGQYVSTIISGLSHPLGISIDPSDNLYIATYLYTSPYTSSVTKYNTSGTLLMTLNNSQMDQSDGVAVDGSGNIYVLNRAQDQPGSNKGFVTKYSPSGAYLGVFSSGYEDPLAISCDPSGNVFVADSHNNQVKIYSPAGVLLNTISGFNDVEGFVADGNGNLYVSDFSSNTVKEFAATGGYHISAPLPAGLSFNTATGEISGTPTVTFPPTTYTITAYNITGSGSTTVTLSCIQSNDWIGATSTDWNTPSNWLGNAVPTSTQTALIGVNKAFNYFPNILAGVTVNVGSIQFGNTGGQAPGVNVNSGATLNISGDITYQSDASSGLNYTASLSGAGTLNVNNINIISNTTLPGSYTATVASSVFDLNIASNLSLTSSGSGSMLFNSTFKVTAGTASIGGIVQTTNSSASQSSLIVAPTTTATLQLAGAAALSGLSSTGANVVTFNNAGTTIEYSGAAQTIYTSASITGLSAGVSYQSIKFSGTGVKTALSGNLNIAGDFTNVLSNDASNYLLLSAPAVNFNGTTQTLTGGAGNGTTFYNVVFSGVGTKTMASGGFNIASTGVLTMSGTNTATVLAANGNLTINSDANGSGSVAALNGPGITGNVNVQRYLTAYRGYRLASSPVYAATVGPNKVYSINYVQNTMYLTGPAGGGFDKTGNPTLYLYREDIPPSRASFISGGFWAIAAMNNSPVYNYSMLGASGSGIYNIPVGSGYLVFFRGDRASASLATETTPSFPATAATMTATGALFQGQVVVREWYTASSPYLNFNNAANYPGRGFNLAGNPYASSIDWEQFNTSSTTSGIYGHNISNTIYEYNAATQNFDTYQQGGAYTNHGRRTIVSGQGFFVAAINSNNPQLIFNESAKTVNQNTGLNLLMDTKNTISIVNQVQDQHLRLQMTLDSINKDDIYIGFSSLYKSQFVDNEDASYRPGSGKVSLASFTGDSVAVAINKMPLPGLKSITIPLYVSAISPGKYTLDMTEINGIPDIYKIWLVDRYNKDSVDMRLNKSYPLSISTDTLTHGSKRFYLRIGQDTTLAMKLVKFTGTKSTDGSQLQWVTTNEQNYTHFTLERSTDGGTTYVIIDGVTSNAEGTYSFLDRSHAGGSNMYRLKIEDLNSNITYSNIVTLMYNNGQKRNVLLYPNPTTGPINLTIMALTNTTQGTNGMLSAPGQAVSSTNNYGIKIVSASGAVIKTLSTTNPNWQSDVSGLLPGTYVLQVTNQKDNSLIGQATFVKL